MRSPQLEKCSRLTRDAACARTVTFFRAGDGEGRGLGAGVVAEGLGVGSGSPTGAVFTFVEQPARASAATSALA
jgi:hypothetical protein